MIWNMSFQNIFLMFSMSWTFEAFEGIIIKFQKNFWVLTHET